MFIYRSTINSFASTIGLWDDKNIGRGFSDIMNVWKADMNDSLSKVEVETDLWDDLFVSEGLNKLGKELANL